MVFSPLKLSVAWVCWGSTLLNTRAMSIWTVSRTKENPKLGQFPNRRLSSKYKQPHYMYQIILHTLEQKLRHWISCIYCKWMQWPYHNFQALVAHSWWPWHCWGVLRVWRSHWCQGYTSSSQLGPYSIKQTMSLSKIITCIH